MFTKEPWATPDRATPKNCYPKKKLKTKHTDLKPSKKHLHFNNSKRNSKIIYPTMWNDIELFGIKMNEKECSRSVPIRNVPLHR